MKIIPNIILHSTKIKERYYSHMVGYNIENIQKGGEFSQVYEKV